MTLVWRRYTLPLIAAVTFGSIGALLLMHSHASAPTPNAEAESGAITGLASAQNDSRASGTKAVKFGSSSNGLALNGLFPIGVFVQPSSNFTTWKNRGINTLVGPPDSVDTPAELNDWAAAADAAGLYQIRDFRADRAADATDNLYIGPAQDDEPDGLNSQVPYMQIQTKYNQWKAINPTKSVYVNFVLNQFDISGACSDKSYRPPPQCESGDSWYAKYVAGADWLSESNYPVNGQHPLSIVGTSIDYLRKSTVGNGKPTFAFIEATDYDLNNGGPGPTTDQFRGEIWDAIIHGARGLWYFPEKVNPGFLFDNTTAAIQTETTTQDATITGLASVLQGPINPSSVAAAVPSPLEVAWRANSTGKYFFVLNLSGNSVGSQTISLTGIGSATSASVYGESRNVPISGGKITDNFGSYAVHIYKLP